MTRETGVLRPGTMLHVLPVVLSLVAVLYLGTKPVTGEPGLPHGDKLWHFFAFGFIQRTHVRAIRFLKTSWSEARMAWSAALMAIAWGGILELVQSFIPYRSCDLLDFLADAAGATFFSWLYLSFSHRRAPKD